MEKNRGNEYYSNVVDKPFTTTFIISLVVLFVLCIITIAFEVIVKTNIYFVWDDAYMFVRYTDNILSSGKIAWNPDGPPTYGLTSMLFLSVILPIRLLFPGSPAITVWLSSAISGIVFFALMITLIKRYVDSTLSFKVGLVALMAVVFAFTAHHISTHLSTGLDTMFVLCFVTIYIMAGKWFEQKRSAISLVVLGLLGGIAFFVRPDILVFTFTVPAIMIVLGPERGYRYKAAGILGITVLTTALSLLISFLYFKSALPLPFFAKGLKSYGESIYAFYSFVPYRQLFEYAFAYSAFLLLILGGVVIGLKKWLREGSSFEKGLLVSVIIFIAYYTFFVLQVMFYHHRFLLPTLPIIIYLGCQGAANLYRNIPTAFKEELSRIPGRFRILIIVFILGFLVFPFMIASNHLVTRLLIGDVWKLRFDSDAKIIWNWETEWFRLDEFSRLPDDLIIATTEVGLPAVMNPGKNIVDMAGLHETEIAHNGFSADYVFEKYNPDLIYLPHPHYINMIDEIKNNEYFRTNYDFYPADDFGVLMDVGIRRDSKYYDEMTWIIEEAPIIEILASEGERTAGY